jgi:non-homologous end joining protein Ku
MRPYWKGYLRLALVSCPIALHAACSTADEEALLAHLKAKQAGVDQQPRQTFAPPHRVVNLMEALRRSVAKDLRAVVPRRRAGAVQVDKPA